MSPTAVDGRRGARVRCRGAARTGYAAHIRALGLRARDRLADNDAHTFFERLGDSVVTGPTRTNVNDFRALLIA